MDLQWHAKVEVPEKTREAIDKRIVDLADEHDDLIHVVIHVEGSNHHRKGVAEAKIRGQARGRELIANGRGEEPAMALDDAVEAFEREVRTMRDKRRDASRGGGSRE